ncbi:hypothetical protein GCM10023170_027980 [Phytohabitans houttuyneae]|uniref:Uncharacterized protein n=1 Tax=Phytohabitans houttuyneae TaxID=1076126 RepID=A0A6V8K3R9_9ACTN|nr:hypothetical protein Phou_011180 [Phytohabitans houttuyneae]
MSWTDAEGEAAGATVRTTTGVAVARVCFGLRSSSHASQVDLIKAVAYPLARLMSAIGQSDRAAPRGQPSSRVQRSDLRVSAFLAIRGSAPIDLGRYVVRVSEGSGR